MASFTPTYFDSESYYRVGNIGTLNVSRTEQVKPGTYMMTGSDPKYPVTSLVGYPVSDGTSNTIQGLHKEKTINGIPLKDYYDNYTKEVFSKGNWFLNKDLPQETKQYDDNSDVQQRMEMFTGLRQSRDREALGKPKKEETLNLFSPEERITGYGYQYGTQGPGYSLTRQKELEDLKKTIKFKTNEKPMEQIQVGRGLAINPEVAAAGGFQQYTRVMPDNISDYSQNQLPGMITGEKWIYSNAPTSQAPVAKNRANRYYSLCQYGPAPGRSTMTAETTRPDFSPKLKNQNRSFINYGFGAPLQKLY
jgi:hypothetical protein